MPGAEPPFEKSVFINCPFDAAYQPVLRAIAFCVVFLGFTPRLAPENPDNGVARLDRILHLILTSKFAIHDISRCRAQSAGEFARMNMPFELGLDLGCRKFGPAHLGDKKLLVLEDTRYDFQKTLSDISGWDIEAHGGNHQKAVQRVRSWLVHQAGAEPIGPSRILARYEDFQGWYLDDQLQRGASEEDLGEYPMHEMIHAMQSWMNSAQPG